MGSIYNMEELLKNPLVLAILAMVLTYAYLYWEQTKKKNQEPINYVIVVAVGLIVFIVAYNCYGSNPSVPVICPSAGGSVKMSEGFDTVGDSATYHLMGKNAIRMPKTDIFIDLARF